MTEAFPYNRPKEAFAVDEQVVGEPPIETQILSGNAGGLDEIAIPVEVPYSDCTAD
jgi:hypothetical protein